MPPIAVKLTPDATSLISTLDRRFRFIKEERIPELHGCAGPSLAVQQSLADEVRDEVGVFAREVESLSMMVDDQSGERARREVKGLVGKYTDDLHELRVQTRTAILASKKAIDTNQRASNRDQLFSTAQPHHPSTKEGSTPQTLVEAQTNLTTALQRTLISLQAELETSVLSTQLLDTSTNALRATSNQHNALTLAMDSSKHLLTALEKADWLDRLLLLGGLGFFVLVVLFILKERFVDRGLRMMFWWWSFVPDFGGDEGMVLRKGKGEETLAQSVVSASVGTATTIAATLSSQTTSYISPSSSDSSPMSVKNEQISTILSAILPSDLPETPTTWTGTLPVMEHVDL